MTRPPRRLDYWRYDHLPPYGKSLIQDWFRRGEQGIGRDPAESFEPFIYTWFALNSWAACVTNQDQDATWRRRLAEDPSLQEEFGRLRATNAEFRQHLDQFVAFWPIFEVKSIRRRYPEYRQHRTPETRAELIPELRARRIPHEPDGWNSGDDVNWPNTLAALARVRNNLFHGDKAAEDLVDQRIVHAALHTLVLFLRHSHVLRSNA